MLHVGSRNHRMSYARLREAYTLQIKRRSSPKKLSISRMIHILAVTALTEDFTTLTQNVFVDLWGIWVQPQKVKIVQQTRRSNGFHCRKQMREKRLEVLLTPITTFTQHADCVTSTFTYQEAPWRCSNPSTSHVPNNATNAVRSKPTEGQTRGIHQYRHDRLTSANPLPRHLDMPVDSNHKACRQLEHRRLPCPSAPEHRQGARLQGG